MAKHAITKERLQAMIAGQMLSVPGFPAGTQFRVGPLRDKGWKVAEIYWPPGFAPTPEQVGAWWRQINKVTLTLRREFDLAPPFVESDDGQEKVTPRQQFVAVVSSREIPLPPTDARRPLVSGSINPLDRRTAVKRSNKRRPTDPNIESIIINRSQAILYCKLLISVFQEALDYDPKRHHNHPQPFLYVDDAKYLREIRYLVAELQTINSHLKRAEPKAARIVSKRTIKFEKHVNTFLHNYSKRLAMPAAWLTIATIASLLGLLGVAPEIIGNILSQIKGLR